MFLCANQLIKKEDRICFVSYLTNRTNGPSIRPDRIAIISCKMILLIVNVTLIGPNPNAGGTMGV